MTQLRDLTEKQFITDALGPLATTASRDRFDDAVLVDLAGIVGAPDAPLLAYSLDQPSFVRHRDATIDPHRYYGRWVAAVTCNDIVAVGGRCRGFSLALAAPGTTEVNDVVSLAHGINDVLARFGATYEGGNLDTGELATVGYAWGLVARRAVVRRAGAQVGDLIAVTGHLGAGWLEYLIRGQGLDDLIDPRDRAFFTAYKAMPGGCADAIVTAAERGWFTSGMDLSDGLVEFLYTIRDRNGVGVVVDADALPLHEATRRNIHLARAALPALGGLLEHRPGLIALDPGYDSPMLHAFTIRPEHVGPARRLFGSFASSLEVIGRVVTGSGIHLDENGRRTTIPPFWDDQFRQASTSNAWVDFMDALR